MLAANARKHNHACGPRRGGCPRRTHHDLNDVASRLRGARPTRSRFEQHEPVEIVAVVPTVANQQSISRAASVRAYEEVGDDAAGARWNDAAPGTS